MYYLPKICHLEKYTTLLYSIKMNQRELFETPQHDEADAAFFLPDTLPAIYSTLNPWDKPADAFYAAVYARMSELPIKGEISRFVDKVNKEGARAACDRGDPDVLAVLGAAGKVQTEIHRITGFLRFSPDSQGVYTANCEPVYFILPALAEHFTLRFGESPWAIIDEKRALCLCRRDGGEARLLPALAAKNEGEDCWEELWRLYHRSVSNEGRKNVRLQRQFMPKRYHKYLSEL